MNVPCYSALVSYIEVTVPDGEVSKLRLSFPPPRCSSYFGCEVLPTRCGIKLMVHYLQAHELWRLLQAKKWKMKNIWFLQIDGKYKINKR